METIIKNDKDLVDGTRLSSISPTRKLNSRNKTGTRGVYLTKDKNKPYRASICLKGNKIELGRFSTLEEAIKARKKAEIEYFNPLLTNYKGENEKASYIGNSGVIDLTGKKFEHFQVLKYAGTKSDGTRLWLCKCNCGNQYISTSTEINKKNKISCGCIEKQIITKPVLQCNCIFVGGTNLTKIKNKKPHKNNHSGTKGIYLDKHGSWYAKLCFKGVTYRVKCSSKIQAIYQRAMLEEKYFTPVIESHKKLLEKKEG